jgi:hypothetical protein
MLPGIDEAIVEPAKIRDYLLSASHPVGRFKAAIFLSLGYTSADWARLRDDLLMVAREGDAYPGQQSEYGQKYEVSGILKGPNGHVRTITTVWLLPSSQTQPKFITAFPG